MKPLTPTADQVLQKAVEVKQRVRLELPLPDFENIDNISGFKQQQEADYRNIKLAAAHMLLAQTCKKLQMLHYNCDLPSTSIVRYEVPNNIFGWQSKYLIERFHLNPVWYNLLEEKDLMECLDKKKLSADTERFRYYFVTILMQHRRGPEYFDEFFEHMKSAKKKIGMIHHLVSDFAKNQQIRQRQVQQNIDSVFRDLLRENKIQALRVEVNDAEIISQIEARYLLKCQRSKEEQIRMECKLAEDKLEKQIKEYLQAMRRSDSSTRIAMATYYGECENLRQKYWHFFEKLRTESEEIGQRIYRKQARLDKMRSKRISLEAQIIRFHEEIDAREDLEEQRLLYALRSKHRRKTLRMRRATLASLRTLKSTKSS